MVGEAAFAAMGEQARVVPVIAFHGTADGLVHPVNGDEVLSQWAQTNDLAADGVDNDGIPEDVSSDAVSGGRTFTELAYEDDTGEVIMEKVVVGGIGHSWSGGIEGGSTSPRAGPLTDPLGPPATEMIWTFFQDHPRPAP